uniref:ATP synthase subunit a n=1 Tax=Diddensiella santjacobensis TaxID=2704139 RepID=S5TFA2_9ASCO|nr:ATP synthase F0 subunit 6 [Diddensiella santjacobensis]AGS44132.1 ATP synthase F0 subunit 6 [Diddensiella santjacobensis]
MLYTIISPLEQFDVNPLSSIEILETKYSLLILSTYVLYILIVLGIVYFLHTYSTTANIIPSKYYIGIEGLLSTIQNMVIVQIGKNAIVYLPFLYGIFILVLFSNLISLIPYNFAIMAQLVYTVAFSTMIWLGVTILGLYIQKLHFFSLFVPAGCNIVLLPILVVIETLSYIARSISLGLRLGSNILAGHLLLVILCGLIYDFLLISWTTFFIGILPLLLLLGIMCLEGAIACIQAYVFTILTCSYIKDSLYGH